MNQIMKSAFTGGIQQKKRPTQYPASEKRHSASTRVKMRPVNAKAYGR